MLVLLQRFCTCGWSSGDRLLAFALSHYLHPSGELASAIVVLSELQSAPSSLDMVFDTNFCACCHMSPDICCWVVSYARALLFQSDKQSAVLTTHLQDLSKKRSLFCEECAPAVAIRHRMMNGDELARLRHFLKGCTILEVGNVGDFHCKNTSTSCHCPLPISHCPLSTPMLKKLQVPMLSAEPAHAVTAG